MLHGAENPRMEFLRTTGAVKSSLQASAPPYEQKSLDIRQTNLSSRLRAE
jgi:hypothetical protein